ncbi:S-layer protein SlpA [Clostridioides difficile]|nr:S-layer protein SlpA [Clostridioides difficile]
MNKKNIAIAMSGLTVLASAAPVFAATAVPVDKEYITVQKDYKETLKKIQAGIVDKSISNIDIKYDGKLVSEYGISGTKVSELTDESVKFYNLVESQLKNMDDGDTVEFIITYNTNNKFYSKAELEDLKTQLENKVVAAPATDGGNGAVMEGESGKAKSADRSITGSDVYDFVIVEDSASGEWTLKAEPKKASELAALNAVYKFQTSFDDGTSTFAGATPFTVTDPTTQVVKSSKSLNLATSLANTTGQVGDLVTENIVPGTNKAVSVKVINAKETTIDIDSSTSTSAEDLAKKYVFDEDELSEIYKVLNSSKGYDGDKVKLVSGRYEVVLYPEGKRLTTKSASSNVDNSPVKLVLKADKVKDMKDYIDDLKTYNNSYSNVVTVAGDDRIETAIELSNKYYNSDDKHAISDIAADSVVLVGSQSIVDGLVASPLASEKHAPLLLTSKDKLDTNVKSEIKRVMDLKSTSGINTSKKVYLAGGVNSISKDVENELKDMGLKVTRLAGDDRYETSLAIADEIGLDNDKAFVVGGTGLADAMSIAPVASQLKDSNGDIDALDGDATPIVVVDGKAKDINAATEDFLDNAQVDIIGGENSVSKDIEKAIDDATGKEPNRTSGEDRQDTNAEVMKETDYFEKAGVENYFVAKDGSTKEDQLVDALAAAPVAANFGGTYTKDSDGKVKISGTVSPAPIVLATDSLSADQNVGVSKSVKDDGGKNLVQVGQGIANSVISKMKDLLDM